MSIANLANSVLPRNFPFVKAQIEEINPTVKAEELPMPLLDGKSPTWVISKLLPQPNSLITSLAVGCCISSISFTVSIFEYATL